MHSQKGRRRLRFLITAGGTREYIDPVRFISNASSGRMGYELARAAVRAGHKATLISAPVSLAAPAGARVVNVETSAQMSAAVQRHFRECDCLIMAAAVADYAPLRRARTKIRKGAVAITLRLKPTRDIVKWAGEHKRGGQIVVGFALEDKKVRANAERKLQEKKLDMIVANTAAAIGAERSSVLIKTAAGDWLPAGNKTKSATAVKVVRLAESLLRRCKGRPGRR